MKKLIYKFYRINEYLFDLLISNQLYFSTINQFNDPYDCHFALKELPSYENFEFFMKQASFSKENYEYHSDMYKKEPENCLTPILEGVKKQLTYFGICCFAGNKDNFLMWSHYADSHKGVCLGFDYEMLTKQFTQFDNVEYNNEPYFFDITDISKSISNAILRKSADWRYEEEVRFLMERSKTCAFDIGALREINFGLKCPARSIVNIIHLTNKLEYFNCTFNKANIAQSKYEVMFEKVNFEELKNTVLKASEHIPFSTEIKLMEK
ncbi:DUF2971 domain-containing protein [Spirosoma fluviale]|uniref:DUF2971 domain-containing protein n=1 Tax=Spirosoma fluviale TaxID=1597977 RepID=A0A286GWD7_9BACT|nr:DUF2971 domain-containing protein [Spirosoma fluviale]SOD99792.1 Protein of unknown function [Spirosoma fluviale]